MSKTVLITGAIRGIGAGIAERMAAEKWNLAICARKNPEQGMEFAAGLMKKYGVEVAYFQSDISSATNREQLVKGVLSRFHALDALVNNAGVAPENRCDLLEMTEESFDRVLNINLKGTFFLTREFARHFAERRCGTIINIGSCSAETASISRGEYCISKAAVGMVTKLFAVKMAEFGVNVYEIRPGVITSDMTSVVKEKYDRLIAGGLTLQPRWGTPDDIGKTVAALLRGDLPYSTGQVINVDGGMGVSRL